MLQRFSMLSSPMNDFQETSPTPFSIRSNAQMWTRSLFFNFSNSMDLNIACSKLFGSSFCCGSAMSASMSSLFSIFMIKLSCPIISIVESNTLFSSCLMSAWLIPFTSHLIIWWNWSSSSSKTWMTSRL